MIKLIPYQENQQGHKKQKRLITSLAILALAITSYSCFAVNTNALVLNDTNGSPYTTKAGDGFLNIVASEAFRRAGLHLKLVKLPPERGLVNANAGIEDGELTRIAGLEVKYPNLIRVPEKIMDWHFVAFSRQKFPKLTNWSSIEKVLVGHIKGWKIFEHSLTSATKVATVNNPHQLFTMLNKNRIDIALFERGLGYAVLKQENMKDVRVLEPPLAIREMFIYLHKRHADKVPAIAAALRAIKAEGLYTQVCREKFAPLAASTSQCDVK